MAKRTVTEDDVKRKTLSALGLIRLGEIPNATVDYVFGKFQVEIPAGRPTILTELQPFQLVPPDKSRRVF
jgi:hypothetical protein